MAAESAFLRSTSLLLPTDRTRLRRSISLTNMKSQRMKFGTPIATLEYQSTRSNNTGDLASQLNYTQSGKFDTSSLNLRPEDQVSSHHQSTAIASPPPLSESLVDLENLERIKKAQELAALRLGGALNESKIYRQTFVIRSYEVGSDGSAGMDMIVSLFQEVAINHFAYRGIGGEGFGATPKMNLYRLIWVITKLHVEVDRYPTWPEAVEIDSWTDGAGKNGMQINWLLREHGTEVIIARGTSTWAMMHKDTRRLSKLPEDVRAEITPTFATTQTNPIDTILPRIAKLDNAAKNIKANITPNRTDLDGNFHVNNITYIRWVLGTVPKETEETHELHSITLEYRRECKKQDVVESLTDTEQADQETASLSAPSAGSPPQENPTGHIQNGTLLYTNGSCIQSSITAPLSDIRHIHLLRLQLKGDEIVRSRTIWKEK